MRFVGSLIEATGAVYMPVSKAANTTIKHMIAEEDLADEMSIHWTSPRGLRRLRNTDFTLNDLADGACRCFTVVRDPIERFASAYRDRVVRARDAVLLDALHAFLGHAPDRPVSVDEVIAYVSETPSQKMDEHLRPQWACCGAGRIPFERIGKVESLRQDLESFVAAGLMTPESLGRYAVRNHSGGYAADELTSAQRSRVKRLYERDYALFGY